jgi:hypothetical protein
MKYALILCISLGACAHGGEEQALAVLAVSVDETAQLYADAKRRRLTQCQGSQTEAEAITCMGPFHGDRGTQLMQSIVAAQQAMAAGVVALTELRELMEDK